MSGVEWSLLDPKGPIAADEKTLILTAFALMLVVVVPVIFMTFAFAWKYRAGNKAATYAPEWDASAKIEAIIWLVPAVIVVVLSVLVWRSSYALSPYRPIVSTAKPVQVEVVAMGWKWLFIYPDLGIATVNRLEIPTGVPVSFRLTSDSVMGSFFIPRLGGQIYAMAGMQTRLHLVADQPGTYAGLNTQFDGDGFPGMRFDTVATSTQGFDAWVRQVKQSSMALDEGAFKKLEVPSKNNSPEYFSAVEPHLFDHVMHKYMSDMFTETR
ncbi:MAG: ubiquinol oxidase subunit II [Betaproteobacteria bacterium]|nr:ubiquinol oxidase subunit II [Betaproteobacteria bacterium]